MPQARLGATNASLFRKLPWLPSGRSLYIFWLDLQSMNEFMETDKAAEGAATPGASAAGDPAFQNVIPTSEEIADLKARAAKADDYWDRLLRMTADLDNFKKRAARERQDAIKQANEGLLQKLIPVADTFDMAIAATQNSNVSVDSLQAGFNMIYSQFKSALADAGLEEIDALNKPFDPNLHEAVAEQEDTDAPEEAGWCSK